MTKFFIGTGNGDEVREMTTAEKDELLRIQTNATELPVLNELIESEPADDASEPS